MKITPVLFSTPMVQAILEGRKTQTRRRIKKQPAINLGWCGTSKKYWSEHPDDLKTEYLKCPYGGIGDVLWVRETYYAYGYWKKDGLTKTGKQKWRFVDRTSIEFSIGYLYPSNGNFNTEKNSFRGTGWYKRNSLFMPKTACRIFLEITDIKVERLQDISEEDAISEGIYAKPGSVSGITWYRKFIKESESRIKGLFTESAKECFQTLWQKINGDESWEANPFVWVISFKRTTKPSDFN